MNDRNMKNMLDKLKEQYEEMPTKSSAANIMSQIKKEKRPWWGSFFHKWQAVAMIVLALGIGGVLTMSQLSNFGSMSNDEASQESLNQTEEFAGTMDQEETSEGEMDTFETPEEPDPASEAQRIEQEGESNNEEEVIHIEGMPETIMVKGILDEELGFSTKINEQYETETIQEVESHTLQVYANYTGERVEPFFFSVTEFYNANDSVDELESLVREQYEALSLDGVNYTESPSENGLAEKETELNVVSELIFETPGSAYQIGIVEYNDTYYSVAIHYYGERSDRIAADMDVILRHARFGE